MNVNIIRSKVAEMLVSVHIPKVLVSCVYTVHRRTWRDFICNKKK